MISVFVCSIVSFFPLANSSHWIFRVFEFIRLQLLALLLLLLLVGTFLIRPWGFWEVMGMLMLLAAIIYHLLIILPYFPKRLNKKTKPPGNGIVLLSVNVKQENRDYEKLIRLVKSIQPDILLTMESDINWEQNLAEIKADFKHFIAVPKNNRYGMHLFTKLEIKDYEVHYLISKEHPSIEARMIDNEGNEFVFWGVHPPPPSPTEKPTARQKDAELMKLAKLTLDTELPVIVAGDFNNVCWSRTSKLFSKISKLRDARINRGFYSTFPAHLWLFRFPIDLLFHAESVFVNRLKVLSSIGSDHLPLLAEFMISGSATPGKHLKKTHMQIVNNKIEEGKEAAKEEN